MKRFFLPAISMILLLAGCQSKPVTSVDKAALLTVSDLRAFGYINPKPPAETWNKTAYGDGTFDIEYEAETPDSDQKLPLYLNEVLSDQGRTADAIAYLATERGATNLVFKTQGLTEKSLPNQIIYGDGSSLTTLNSEGLSVGNVFSARKGGRTFSLMIIGSIAFEDAQAWDDFAGKKIRAWLAGAR